MKDRLYVLALEIYALYLVALAWLYGAIAWTIEEVAIPRYRVLPLARVQGRAVINNSTKQAPPPARNRRGGVFFWSTPGGRSHLLHRQGVPSTRRQSAPASPRT